MVALTLQQHLSNNTEKKGENKGEMAHDFLIEKEENLSGKKAKVKVGQEGEQQQMNSGLKEYSRAICKRNNTVGRAGDSR